MKEPTIMTVAEFELHMADKEHHVVFTYMSPEVAAHILSSRSGPNRNIVKADVNKMVRAMKKGEWLYAGQTICFNTNEELQDGQHRLTACVNAGVPFETLLVFGLTPYSVTVTDQNRVRNQVDQAMCTAHLMTGNLEGYNSTSHQRITRELYKFLYGKSARKSWETRQILYSLYNKYKDEIDFIVGALKPLTNKGLLNSFIVGVCTRAAICGAKQENIVKFMEAWTSGIGAPRISYWTSLRRGVEAHGVHFVTRIPENRTKMETLIAAYLRDPELKVYPKKRKNAHIFYIDKLEDSELIDFKEGVKPPTKAEKKAKKAKKANGISRHHLNVVSRAEA